MERVQSWGAVLTISLIFLLLGFALCEAFAGGSGLKLKRVRSKKNIYSYKWVKESDKKSFGTAKISSSEKVDTAKISSSERVDSVRR